MNKQNPNSIKNPKLAQVPKTPQMNDRDFANDALATEKYMTSAYSMALNEASHQDLYQALSTIANETQDCQRNLYNLMFQKGWYGIEQEAGQKIQNSIQQFDQYLQQQSPYTGGGMVQ
jgi:spore coat protein CotF